MSILRIIIELFIIHYQFITGLSINI